jgi:hydroxymethylpyrimidine/phosphomethylpyrimidine kinase
MSGTFDAAHDALNRMKRAHARGTGCHLTAYMIASLGLTFLAEAWGAADPRISKQEPQP